MLAWTVRAPISWRPREEARPTGRTPPRPGPAPEARRTRCAEFLIEEFFPLGLVRKEKGRGGKIWARLPGSQGTPKRTPKLGSCHPERGLAASPLRGRRWH